MKDDPRAIALDILNALDGGRFTLDRIIEDALEKARLRDKRDRALVTTLVYGVLRRKNTIDRTISHFSTTRVDRIDPHILNILRLGVFQLRYLDRIPSFAAVDSSVKLAKKGRRPHLAGFVNGVLRSVARDPDLPPAPEVSGDPVEALSFSKSFPAWLLERWIGRFGFENTVKMCDSMNGIPPITVRVNTLRADRQKVERSLAAEVGKVEKARFLNDALYIFSPSVPVHSLTAFVNGWFQVQDEAAQLICRLVDPRPGERVLDACAGLGGKTGHMAQLMKNSGRIVAVDREEHKLVRLKAEMSRLGVTNTERLQADLLKPGAIDALGLFDRVLADCPCSGLGVIRRNPDTKWRIAKEDLSGFSRNQLSMLDNLAARVKRGGVLVYSVCSIEPEECEDVVSAFLNRHPEFDIEGREAAPPAVAPFFDEKGCFFTVPFLHGLDGFFGVRFKRSDG